MADPTKVSVKGAAVVQRQPSMGLRKSIGGGGPIKVDNLAQAKQGIPDSWNTYYTMQMRDVNLPNHPVFKPRVKLDPSQVQDRRPEAIKPQPSFVQQGLLETWKKLLEARQWLGNQLDGRDRFAEAQDTLKRFNKK